MSSLYIALSIFVASSVALGFIALADERFAWLPLLLGMFGAGLLFYTSVLLIAETRIARIAINHEMDFAIRRTQLYASPKMLEYQQRQRRSLLDRLR
jgi:TctA family transporter